MEVYHSLWYPIRCKTIDKIEENKEEIMSIVYYARAAKLGTIVFGTIAAGIVLAPFTFGGSIAISALGGAVGAAAAAGSIATIFVEKALNNKKLKKAQQHINLDRQISLMINIDAKKYDKIRHDLHKSESSLHGLHGAAAIGRGAVALRTTGPVAGMALAGASLAVTIPMDIGAIAYHSYNIHKSRNDSSGKTESDKAVKSLYNQAVTLLKGIVCMHVLLYMYMHNNVTFRF